MKNMESIQKMDKVPFSEEKGDFFDTIALMSKVSALSPDERLRYDRWRKFENDRLLREQRIAREATEQGKEQAKWENIEALYKAGVDVKTLSKALNIPETEIISKLNITIQ